MRRLEGLSSAVKAQTLGIPAGASDVYCYDLEVSIPLENCRKRRENPQALKRCTILNCPVLPPPLPAGARQVKGGRVYLGNNMIVVCNCRRGWHYIQSKTCPQCRPRHPRPHAVMIADLEARVAKLEKTVAGLGWQVLHGEGTAGKEISTRYPERRP